MLVIVGATGFLASHLRMRLAERAAQEVILVGRSGLPFEEMDHERLISAADFAGAEGDAILRRASAVVYLATVSTVATFAAEPWRDLAENADPFMRLLHRLGQLNPECKLILISSGGTVYGSISGLERIKEDHPLRPISPYGLTKLVQEQALQFASRTSGLGYNILRISNPVGVHFRSVTQGLVTVALQSVQTGRPLPLYGDGSHIRDVMDADDAADAMIMAAADTESRANIWNIGSGCGISNRDVLAMVERVTGKAVPIEHRPERAVDVLRVVLDTSLAEAELGWRARRDLETTIAEIWRLQQTPDSRLLRQ